MTNPSDPRQRPQPQPPGPYGPPPQQQPPPGGFPDPRRQPDEPPRKGMLGALFDADFNHLVTPRLIKFGYLLSLLLITLAALTMAGVGVWVAQLHNGWLVGLLIICATPVFWLFSAVLVRLFMEGIVVRFKQNEHLQAIKYKL